MITVDNCVFIRKQYLANVLKLSNNEIDKWGFEFYIIAIDTTGSNEIRVFRLPAFPVTARDVAIHNFMIAYLWHLGTDSWDHSYDYYTGDGSETLNL